MLNGYNFVMSSELSTLSPKPVTPVTAERRREKTQRKHDRAYEGKRK